MERVAFDGFFVSLLLATVSDKEEDEERNDQEEEDGDDDCFDEGLYQTHCDVNVGLIEELRE